MSRGLDHDAFDRIVYVDSVEKVLMVLIVGNSIRIMLIQDSVGHLGHLDHAIHRVISYQDQLMTFAG